MVLGPTHGSNAVKCVMRCASAYSQKLKEKPKNPFVFFLSIPLSSHHHILPLSCLLTTYPILHFSHTFSRSYPLQPPLSLSLSLTLLSLSHSLHQFTSFPPSSFLSLCFFFLWIPVSHHAVILTALFITMTSS